MRELERRGLRWRVWQGREDDEDPSARDVAELADLGLLPREDEENE